MAAVFPLPGQVMKIYLLQRRTLLPFAGNEVTRNFLGRGSPIHSVGPINMMTPATTDASLKLRFCLSEPISQLKDAARYLDAAVSAHLQNKPALAEELFGLADMPEIRQWTKSIWANSEVHVRFRSTEPTLARELRVKERMPSAALKEQVHHRDGYNCRFCGLPVVRSQTRKRLRDAYPAAINWGNKEILQHAALQAMWAQYDHIVPHARGGTNDLDNLVLTCAPCNFGRAGYSLHEVGVSDPRSRLPVKYQWDGLERFYQRGPRVTVAPPKASGVTRISS